MAASSTWEPARRLRHLTRVSGHLLPAGRHGESHLRLLLATSGSSTDAPEPLYISEQLEASSGPTFTEIDWTQIGPRHRERVAGPATSTFRLVLLHQAHASVGGMWMAGQSPDCHRAQHRRYEGVIEWEPVYATGPAEISTTGSAQDRLQTPSDAASRPVAGASPSGQATQEDNPSSVVLATASPLSNSPCSPWARAASEEGKTANGSIKASGHMPSCCSKPAAESRTCPGDSPAVRCTLTVSATNGSVSFRILHNGHLERDKAAASSTAAPPPQSETVQADSASSSGRDQALKPRSFTTQTKRAAPGEEAVPSSEAGGSGTQSPHEGEGHSEPGRQRNGALPSSAHGVGAAAPSSNRECESRNPDGRPRTPVRAGEPPRDAPSEGRAETISDPACSEESARHQPSADGGPTSMGASADGAGAAASGREIGASRQVQGWRARPWGGDAIVFDRVINLAEDLTFIARDASVLARSPDLSALPPGSLLLEVSCLEASASRNAQEAAESLATSEAVERLLKEWARLRVEGRTAAADACKKLAGRLQKRFHLLHPSRCPPSALFVYPPLPDAVLAQLREDNSLREEKSATENKGQAVSVLSLVKGWFLPTRAAQAPPVSLPAQRDADSQRALTIRTGLKASTGKPSALTARTLAQHTLLKGLDSSHKPVSVPASLDLYSTTRFHIARSIYDEDMSTPAVSRPHHTRNRSHPSDVSGSPVAGSTKSSAAKQRHSVVGAWTYYDVSLRQQLYPKVQSALDAAALVAKLRSEMRERSERLANRHVLLGKLRALQLRNAELRQRNAMLEKALVASYRKATQLERAHKAVLAGRAQRARTLAAAGELLQGVRGDRDHRVYVWRQTHRALVGRQCHLCAEIGDVFRIGPKVVTVYGGGVLAHMENGWMRGSAAGGGGGGLQGSVSNAGGAAVPGGRCTRSTGSDGSWCLLSETAPSRPPPQPSQAATKGPDGLSITQQPVMSILDLQMNADLAGKAIRGELGWENTTLFNPHHINAQLFYTAMVVDMLSAILDVPLRYHLRLFGSHTTVVDPAPPLTNAPLDTSAPIKSESGPPKAPPEALGPSAQPPPEREFPLYLTDGKNHSNMKLATATFWLAKDVELLMEAYNLYSSGPRETLANLYKLITAARTAAR